MIDELLISLTMMFTHLTLETTPLPQPLIWPLVFTFWEPPIEAGAVTWLTILHSLSGHYHDHCPEHHTSSNLFLSNSIRSSLHPFKGSLDLPNRINFQQTGVFAAYGHWILAITLSFVAFKRSGREKHWFSKDDNELTEEREPWTTFVWGDTER